jgi:Phosphotransferase enzyme family
VSEPLGGGRQTPGVVRVGETIRRPLHRNSEFAHAVLRHLEAVGFTGAPRLLGIDDEGREILTYVEGRVFSGPENVGDSVTILSDTQIVSAAGLIRGFHDATAGSALAGSAGVVCHGDLGQHNIVFCGDEARAIVDWDEDVAPGSRLVDLAHAAWCLAEIGESGGETSEQARRLRLVCEAYGWPDAASVLDELEARFVRAGTWHAERGATEGARIFSDMLDWLLANRAALLQAA